MIFRPISALNRFDVYFIGYGYNVAIWGKYSVTEGGSIGLFGRLIRHGWGGGAVCTRGYLHFILNVVSLESAHLFFPYAKPIFGPTESDIPG